MTTNPLVSILVPSYNHSSFVEDTIKSILAQTYENVELIVIDDGSTDNSADIIERLATDAKFTYICQHNHGVAATLNQALSLATGKYISLCASDDIYFSDKIATQVQYLEQYPEYGMCYGKVLCFNESIDHTWEYPTSNKKDWVYDDLLHGCFIPAPSTFIRRDVIEEVGGFDETLWIEDWDLWLRISLKYPIGYQDKFFTYYRQHENNLSTQAFKMYIGEKATLNKHVNHHKHRALLNDYSVKWFSQLSQNHKREALRYLLPALKQIYRNPTVIKGIVKLIFKKSQSFN